MLNIPEKEQHKTQHSPCVGGLPIEHVRTNVKNTDANGLRIIGDLLGDATVSLDDDLLDMQRGLDGLGLLVDPFEFFEGTALRFDTGGY